MIIRAEMIGMNRAPGSSVSDILYDILADQKSDLADFAKAGIGSMAYTRQAEDGDQKWVLTDSGWEAVDDAGDAEVTP